MRSKQAEPRPEGGGALGARQLILGILFLTAIIYYPAVHGGFVYDDNPAIVANGELGDLADRAAEALTGRRTLTDFTFALNLSLGGLKPFGFHVVNIVIHIANAMLVFHLGMLLLPALGTGVAVASRAAGAGAILFAVHPLHTQAVAYIAQRYTTLATFFYLGAVILYLRGRMRSSWASILLALVSGFAAMRCKEIAFTLPIVIILAEWFLFAGDQRKMSRALLFLLLLPLIPLSLMTGDEGTSRNLSRESLGAFRETEAISRSEYLATQIFVIPRYLGLIVWPRKQTIDHEIATAKGWDDPRIPAGAAVLVFFATGAWAGRRKFSIFSAAFLWFVVTIAVESSVVPIRDVMVEHRAYLPSVVLFLAAGVILMKISRRGLAVIALTVVFSLAAHNRAKVWAGPETLWTDAVRKTPGKARPYVNLGLAMRGQGRHEESVKLAYRAIEIDSTIVEARYGAAISLGELGRTEEALEQFATARRIAPDYGPAYDGAALLAMNTGDAAGAVHLLEEGLRASGEAPVRLAILGDALAADGNSPAAERAHSRALALDPSLERSVVGRARALVMMGRSAEAVQFLEEVVRRGDAGAHTWNALGIARREEGNREGAADAFRRALSMDPALAEAARNLERLELSR